MFPDAYWRKKQEELDAIEELDDDNGILEIYLGAILEPIGRFICLPCDEELLMKAYNIITFNGSFDHHIPSAEGVLASEASKTTDLIKLNNLAQELLDFDGDMDVVEFLHDDCSMPWDSAMEEAERVTVYNSESDFLYDQMELMGIPDNCYWLIDMGKFKTAVLMDYSTTSMKGKFYVFQN